MSARVKAVRVILRVLRWLSWSALASFSILTIVNLETLLRRSGISAPVVQFSIAELLAVFCCATAVDRAFSLGEKSFDERD